jgi:predicted  nucleic acid-binding Zn-ribbon protein
VSIREQLVALAKLGRIDASTQDLDRELKEIPQEVGQLRESVSLLEGLLAKKRRDLEEALKLREQHETAVRESADAIAKAKAKGAKAKNAREAEAVERELEVLRRSQKDRESERERLSAAITQVQTSLDQHEKEFSGLKEMLTQKDAEGQARIAVLEAQRAEALKGRDELAALVPKDVVMRYDQLRARRGSGVAEVREGICRGCRMSVRPMQYIVIQREEGIERCAHCQRYLYWGKWLTEDEKVLSEGEQGSES